MSASSHHLDCHLKRSGCSAKRSSRAVERPCVPRPRCHAIGHFGKRNSSQTSCSPSTDFCVAAGENGGVNGVAASAPLSYDSLRNFHSCKPVSETNRKSSLSC